MKEEATLQKYYTDFISEAVKQEKVFALENKDGIAYCFSNNYEDADGVELDVLCYWSSVQRAEICQEKEWQDYKVKEISLTEFMENWCVGMASDGVILGANFDKALYGFESDPLETILDIIKELKLQKKSLKYKNYSDEDDFYNAVKEVIES